MAPSHGRCCVPGAGGYRADPGGPEPSRGGEQPPVVEQAAATPEPEAEAAPEAKADPQPLFHPAACYSIRAAKYSGSRISGPTRSGVRLRRQHAHHVHRHGRLMHGSIAAVVDRPRPTAPGRHTDDDRVTASTTRRSTAARRPDRATAAPWPDPRALHPHEPRLGRGSSYGSGARDRSWTIRPRRRTHPLHRSRDPTRRAPPDPSVNGARPRHRKVAPYRWCRSSRAAGPCDANPLAPFATHMRRRRLMRSCSGGWVANRPTAFRRTLGLVKNMCATPSETFMGAPL